MYHAFLLFFVTRTMPSILLTGVSTLDIINTVDGFPIEDSEVRASEQTVRTGGNACNSAKVLQQLGVSTSLLANTADDLSASYILGELSRRKINTALCPTEKNSLTPTSYITLNRQNGSRTIVHHRKLNELPASIFNTLTLQKFDWFHFEGRNCQQLVKALAVTKTHKKTISIELEKPREYINDIMQFADILFISKHFAESKNFRTPAECVQHFSQLYPEKIITCTWGDQGVWAYDTTDIFHQTAFTIEQPIETLGAGDTFNAGFIYAKMNQYNVKESLKFACQLAANKCLQSGFNNITIPTL